MKISVRQVRTFFENFHFSLAILPNNSLLEWSFPFHRGAWQEVPLVCVHVGSNPSSAAY